MNSTQATSDNANRCVCCGEDLGDCNPRQLCGKTFCYYEPALLASIYAEVPPAKTQKDAKKP